MRMARLHLSCESSSGPGGHDGSWAAELSLTRQRRNWRESAHPAHSDDYKGAWRDGAEMMMKMMIRNSKG